MLEPPEIAALAKAFPFDDGSLRVAPVESFGLTAIASGATVADLDIVREGREITLHVERGLWPAESAPPIEQRARSSRASSDTRRRAERPPTRAQRAADITTRTDAVASSATVTVASWAP